MAGFGDALLPFIGEPSKKDDSGNYEAIGRLIVAYAYTEIALHLLVRKLTGLSDKKARLLFGGSRISDVVQKIRALLPLLNRSATSISRIEMCLDQFEIIGKQRDKIVHRASNHGVGEIGISNLLTAKSLLHTEYDQFIVSDLKAMEDDCYVIYLLLSTVFSPKRKRSPVVLRLLKTPLPWTYKLPRPINKPKHSRPHPSKHQRPPESSRG